MKETQNTNVLAAIKETSTVVKAIAQTTDKNGNVAVPCTGISSTPGVVRKLISQKQVSVNTARARSNGDAVRICLKHLGWKENDSCTDTESDIFWHSIVYSDMRNCVSSGKVNKFPGMKDVVKKVALTRSLSTLRRMFPQQYHFYPRSWFLPAQLQEYIDYHRKRLDKVTKDNAVFPWYIVKPDHGAQGGGIYLINGPEQLQNVGEPQLIQEYIIQPYLFQDRLKFDLRVYAVIKSVNPLSIYVAREGMVRFATVPYRPPSAGNFSHTFMHLTNFSLNKTHENFVLSDEGQSGNKRLLSAVFHQMSQKGVNTDTIWHKIELIIVKTILAIIPEIIINYEQQFPGGDGPQCFQILGFDILLTKQLEPVLLEVNACPSLSIATVEAETEGSENSISVIDQAIKVPIVRDTLKLIMNMAPATKTASVNAPVSVAVDDTSWDSNQFCLSQLFPSPYSQSCGPMLFLHRAAYVFLQFVNVRRTLIMTSSNCKQFIRKCSLADCFPITEVDVVFPKIQKLFEGYCTEGIPFHGFITFLQCVGRRKFPDIKGNTEALRNLLHHCEFVLSYHGVSSARLRPDRESLASAAERGRLKEYRELYLLRHRPSATKRKRDPSAEKNNAARFPQITGVSQSAQPFRSFLL